MKKAKRILALLAALALCISLCGCSLLDTMRNMRATMTEEGDIKLYDGTVYKLLPQCEELFPQFTGLDMVYIVEDDLPLLLTAFAENGYNRSDDGWFLLTYTDDGEVLYCRADVYDSVLDRIQNGFTAEMYCYTYFDYDEDESATYTLTQEQAELLELLCATQEPQVLAEELDFDWEYMADLYLYTEDRLFAKNTLDICIANDRYYVLDYTENDEMAIYKVPAEMTAEFEKIMEKVIESDTYYAQW